MTEFAPLILVNLTRIANDVSQSKKPAKRQSRETAKAVGGPDAARTLFGGSMSLDGHLTRSQRLALASIVNYYFLIMQSKGAAITRHEVAKQISRFSDTFDRKYLDNLLYHGSPRGADHIYAYFKTIVTNDTFYTEAPNHIQVAIREVFGYPTAEPLPPSLSNQILASFKEIDAGSIDRICSKYSGVWNFIRYANQLEPSLQVRDLSSTTWISRAAIEIFPPEPRAHLPFPTFKMHERLGFNAEFGDFYSSSGSIYPISHGSHMLFIGYNLWSEPLIIVANCTRADLPRFIFGLINARSGPGFMFASRAVIVRSPSQTLSELTQKIGVYDERDLIESTQDEIPDLPHVLTSIRNVVPMDGKSGLILESWM
jgi:hypothetical protein